MKKYLFLIFLLLSGCVSVKLEKKIILINPYRDVNWEKYERYKANLHTHTTESDGKETPEKVIFLYKNKGYSILAITDHNKMTYFPEENRIFLIKGIEFGKKSHHILGYFSFEIPENLEISDENEFLKCISQKDGIAVFAHPGRYNKSIEWYIDFFEKYPNLIGIEVLNPSVQKNKIGLCLFLATKFISFKIISTFFKFVKFF